MKILVVAVGRLKAEYARLGCARFLERLGHLESVEMVEVADVRRRKGDDVDRWRADEAEALLDAVPPGAVTVALDERGREWTSPEFAEWLGEQRDLGVPAVAFLIGGPDGLDRRVRKAATRVWRLGRTTMSHELARLVLCEQLYRAATILRGMPYHRG